MKQGKAFIFSAPSGSGKTTIVKHLLSEFDNLQFSVSATTRDPRPGEQDGVDYYFLDPESFKQKIDEGKLVEWEEVYPNVYYGTLKSELERIWHEGNHVVFDVDVVGGSKLNQLLGDAALGIFIKVKDVQTLMDRLGARGTESEDKLIERVSKAQQEMQYESHFDVSIINENLEVALTEAEKLVSDFIS